MAVITLIIHAVHSKVEAIIKTDAPLFKDKAINKAVDNMVEEAIAFSRNVRVSKAPVVTGKVADMDMGAMIVLHHAMMIKKLTRSKYKIKYAKRKLNLLAKVVVVRA